MSEGRWTNRLVAQKLGVTGGTVGNWRKGVGLPRADTAIAVSLLLETPIALLIEKYFEPVSEDVSYG